MAQCSTQRTPSYVFHSKSHTDVVPSVVDDVTSYAKLCARFDKVENLLYCLVEFQRIRHPLGGDSSAEYDASNVPPVLISGQAPLRLRSKAIKIVNPETQHELRLDTSVPRCDNCDDPRKPEYRLCGLCHQKKRNAAAELKLKTDRLKTQRACGTTDCTNTLTKGSPYSLCHQCYERSKKKCALCTTRMSRNNMGSTCKGCRERYESLTHSKSYLLNNKWTACAHQGLYGRMFAKGQRFVAATDQSEAEADHEWCMKYKGLRIIDEESAATRRRAKTPVLMGRFVDTKSVEQPLPTHKEIARAVHAPTEVRAPSPLLTKEDLAKLDLVTLTAPPAVTAPPEVFHHTFPVSDGRGHQSDAALRDLEAEHEKKAAIKRASRYQENRLRFNRDFPAGVRVSENLRLTPEPTTKVTRVTTPEPQNKSPFVPYHATKKVTFASESVSIGPTSKCSNPYEQLRRDYHRNEIIGFISQPTRFAQKQKQVTAEIELCHKDMRLSLAAEFEIYYSRAPCTTDIRLLEPELPSPRAKLPLPQKPPHSRDVSDRLVISPTKKFSLRPIQLGRGKMLQPKLIAGDYYCHKDGQLFFWDEVTETFLLD